jgi:hypothetical protein
VTRPTPNASLTAQWNETAAHFSRDRLTRPSLAEDTLRTAGLEKITHTVRPLAFVTALH